MSRPWVYQRLRDTRSHRSCHPSQPRTMARRHRTPSVIVYVYVSRARLHVKARRRACRRRRRQSHTATTRGAARPTASTTEGGEPAGIHSRASRGDAAHRPRQGVLPAPDRPAPQHQDRQESRRITDQQLAEFIASQRDMTLSPLRVASASRHGGQICRTQDRDLSRHQEGNR